jgi:3-oxoacyl-[acyl-carrier protein] reductase
MLNLEGKGVLITGSSRGIGREAARMMVECGANVVINYRRRRDMAEGLVAQLNARTPGKAAAVQADVSDRAQVERMVEETVERLGRIDVLVNNAGIWTYGSIADMPAEVWDETIRVNLNSTYYCCRLVVPLMMRQGGGRIINVSSTAGQRGEAFHSHYAATKGAIISLTKSLAAELAPHNILVNCVAPGWVDTDMSTDALEKEKDAILSTIPLKRPGKAAEIAGAILFLASNLSTYVNGEILNVNGGSVLCG